MAREPRRMWRSTNGGRTWEEFTASPGSYLWAIDLPQDRDYDDGLGNLYRATPPEQD